MLINWRAELRPRRMGIRTGGGDPRGLNAVIRGAVSRFDKSCKPGADEPEAQL